MEGYKDPFNRRTYPWERLSVKQEENLMFTRRIARLRTDNTCLRTGFYKTLLADGGIFAFERYLKDGKDYFGKEGTGSQKIVLITNKSDEPEYVTIDDSNEGLKAAREEKAAVPLTNRYIVGGQASGKMEIGLQPKSFVFVLY